MRNKNERCDMTVTVTLKQLEALYWIAQLGTFERAALKMNTTQSAISKRIQELEAASGIAIFDRSLRGARLTERGEYLVAIAEEMLERHDRIIALKTDKKPPMRKLRLGVTELTAMTWLPRLVASLQETYPSLILEPEVDMSRNLYERLLEETIDLVVMPEAFIAPEITAIRIAEVENVWMARPGLVDASRPLHISELAHYPALIQGGRSGSGLYFSKWLKAEGVSFERHISSDSLTAMIGLTVAGIGVSYVPLNCFQPLVDEGKLVILDAKPALPLVPYAAMFRNDRPFTLMEAVAKLAARVCDFSRQFQS